MELVLLLAVVARNTSCMELVLLLAVVASEYFLYGASIVACCCC